MTHVPHLPRRILAVVLALPCATFVQADTRTLEEITVTAQKVSESLQKVPISVSVATAQDIKDINAFNFRDLEEITPGVAFGGGAGLQSAAIRIRGVGPAFFALGTPPNVAVFVDEVAQSQIGAVFSTMVDISRVELLRGPQGTLYGRNAPGGAYNITTNDPDHDGLGGYVESNYSLYDESPDFATLDVRGAVNIPLIEDKLAWRVAGVYADSDGFVEMENPESSDDTSGGFDNRAVRSKLLWHASDDIDLKWTANYQDLEQNPAGFNYDGLVPGTGGTNATPAINNEFEKRKGYGNRASLVTGKIKDSSLHLGWETSGPRIDLIGFYQEFDTFSDEQREPYPGGVSKFEIEANAELTTLELRLSDSSDQFDYVAGLYYFDSMFDATNEIRIQGVDVNGDNALVTEGYAAFANVNLHLCEDWDLSLGVRYDDVEDVLDASTTFSGVDARIDDGKLEFDHVSWSVKLRNYITEDITAYLAVDHAFKQGGFNGLVAGVAALNETFGLAIPPAVAIAAEDTLDYDKETSDAIELGIKGKVLNDRVAFGVNIFYQQYDDHQVAQTNQTPDALGGIFGSFFLAAIDNAEEVETVGIEANGSYLIGDHWDLTFRASYAEATVEEWSTRFCPSGENATPDQLYCPRGNGEELNNLPKINTNAQLGYTDTLDSGWELYSRATWTWQSAPANTNLTDDFSESKSFLGFSLGLRDADSGLDIRAWGKNLTDEHKNIDPGRKANGDPDLPFAFQGSFSPGRQLGVSVRYAF
ncbi:MAG: TonB-dependent receptor [Halioglobus sp.]|nr:TonB-dependent receptor [Halioglobus sp.]